MVNVIGLLVLVGFLSLVAVWIGALVDAGGTTNEAFTRANTNKGMVMALLILAGWFGALYWFAVMRRRVKD